MFNVISVTLRNNNAVLVQKTKEIKTNNLDSLVIELKRMQTDVNGLLTSLVDNRTSGELDEAEVGDDEDEDSDSTTGIGENGISSPKRTKHSNRGSKKKKNV